MRPLERVLLRLGGREGRADPGCGRPSRRACDVRPRTCRAGALGRGVSMPPGDSVISVVDADPDLADLLDDASLERARRDGLARVKRLSPGEWDAQGAYEQAEHHR